MNMIYRVPDLNLGNICAGPIEKFSFLKLCWLYRSADALVLRASFGNVIIYDSLLNYVLVLSTRLNCSETLDQIL